MNTALNLMGLNDISCFFIKNLVFTFVLVFCRTQALLQNLASHYSEILFTCLESCSVVWAPATLIVRASPWQTNVYIFHYSDCCCWKLVRFVVSTQYLNELQCIELALGATWWQNYKIAVHSELSINRSGIVSLARYIEFRILVQNKTWGTQNKNSYMCL